MDAKNRLTLNIQRSLAELHDVIGHLSFEQFSRSLTIFSGSSIGMHARHILEFYQCLLQQSSENQWINYDIRQRDQALQTDRAYFQECVLALIEALDNLDESHLKKPLSITNNEDGFMPEPVVSCLARELQYNLEHTIHHAAFIKIGVLTLLPEVVLPETFGVAPSTLSYRKRQTTTAA